MKKALICLLLAVLLLTLTTSCRRQADSAAKPLIVVSIHPYQLLVQQAVGDIAEVRTLIPAGASPHTWSPAPADMQALEDAVLIISNGLDLEVNLEKVFDKYAAKHYRISDLIVLDALEAEDDHDAEHHDHDADDHHHGDYDPHLWTSPRNLIVISTALRMVLYDFFREQGDAILENFGVLIGELEALDREIAAERAALPDFGIVTYHNSFHYFTQQYDIEYVGFVQSAPGKEPTPQELAKLGDRIRAKRIAAIFIEPQMNPKSAEVLAKEFGLRLLSIDPLGTTLQVNTIAEMIRANWEVMKQGISQ